MSAKINDGRLCFRKGLKKLELGGSDIAWVYLQVESGSGKMCCGNLPYSIYRVIVLAVNGEKHIFMFEDEKTAKELVAGISSLGEGIAVGYTAENKKRFGIEEK